MAILGVLLICYSSRGHQMVFAYPPPHSSSSDSYTHYQGTMFTSNHAYDMHHHHHLNDSTHFGKSNNTTFKNHNNKMMMIMTSEMSMTGTSAAHLNRSSHYNSSSNAATSSVMFPDLIHTSGGNTDSSINNGSAAIHVNNVSSSNNNHNNLANVSIHATASTKTNATSTSTVNNHNSGNTNDASSHINNKLTSTPSNPMATTTSNSNIPTTTTTTSYDQHTPFREKFLGFDSQTLSDLLSPKVALCDKKFELTIDQVTFVGHATLLNADRPGTGNRFARSVQKRHMLRSMIQNSMMEIPIPPIAYDLDSETGGHPPRYSNDNDHNGHDYIDSNSDNRGIGNNEHQSQRQHDCQDTSISFSLTRHTKVSSTDQTSINKLRSSSTEVDHTRSYAYYQNRDDSHDHRRHSSMVESSHSSIGTSTAAAADNQNAVNNTSSLNPDTSSNSMRLSYENLESRRYYHQRHMQKEDFRVERKIESNKKSTQSNLTMFNLVIAMTPDDSKDFSQSVDYVYSHVISKISAALKYEQLKRSFIRREAELILGLKEKYFPRLSSGKMTVQEMSNLIINSSQLASILAQLYHEINDTGISRLIIDSSMDVSIRLPNQFLPGHQQGPYSHSSSSSSYFNHYHPHAIQCGDDLHATATIASTASPTQNEIQEATTNNEEEYPNIYPYHALLLLADPEEILRILPADHSPILALLIQIVTPTQSLEELQVKLDCSMAHLYRLVAHLVYWKQAKIINVISTKNVYVPSPTADLSQLSYHQVEFCSQFPNLSLLDILSELHVTQPYSAIIPSKEYRTLYLEALTYLLRHDLVVHLHMYVYIMATSRILQLVLRLKEMNSNTTIDSASPTREKINDASNEHAGTKDRNGQEDNQSNEDYIIPDPQNPSHLEKLYIEAMARSQGPPLDHAFLSLVRYFNGKYQVDEILILENMSRKDFRNILR